MIGAGDVRIERKDVNNDQKIDAADFDQQMANVKQGDMVEVDGVGKFSFDELQAKLATIKSSFLAASASNLSPEQSEAQIKSAKSNISNLFAQGKEAEEMVNNLKSKGNLSPEEQQRVRDTETKLLHLKEMIKANIQNLQKLVGPDKPTGLDSKILEFAGLSPEGQGGEAKAQMTMGGGQAGTAQTGAKAMGTQPGFTPPANWGAQTAYPQFSTSAYMQSTAMEDSILSSFDSVLKNQNKGKQLMMLFFYFARMAESGDLGAMYQFMKFLTYIISKDKAKQQIDMGKKLIELQDLSRKWTDKLLGMQTNSTDPNSSNDFMKVMTQVKSETDAIATSQKLISQMMEEFSQIVETLTNTTKAALEANGRVMRTVSSVR